VRQPCTERLPILLVQKDRCARITSRHHVIQRASKLNAKRTGHPSWLRLAMWQNKT
jgi:hypothetical protein